VPTCHNGKAARVISHQEAASAMSIVIFLLASLLAANGIYMFIDPPGWGKGSMSGTIFCNYKIVPRLFWKKYLTDTFVLKRYV